MVYHGLSWFMLIPGRRNADLEVNPILTAIVSCILPTKCDAQGSPPRQALEAGVP